MTSELSIEDVTSDRLGGSRDVRTSQSASWDNLPRSGSQRYQVLEAIVASGDRGMTNDELAERLGMANGASGSPGKRASELCQSGWIMDSGLTRRTRLGSEARVWVLTPEADQLLSE